MPRWPQERRYSMREQLPVSWCTPILMWFACWSGTAVDRKSHPKLSLSQPAESPAEEASIRPDLWPSTADSPLPGRTGGEPDHGVVSSPFPALYQTSASRSANRARSGVGLNIRKIENGKGSPFSATLSLIALL